MRAIWDKLNRYLQNEHGFALVLILILVVVMSVFAVGVLGTTATSIKQSTTDRDHQSVYYIAEAGLMEGYDEIKRTIESDTHIDNINFIKSFSKVYNHFEPVFGEQPEAEVTVEEIGDNNFKITSTGTIGKQSRTVTATFMVEEVKGDEGGPPTLDLIEGVALFSDGDISMSGSATVNGDFATNSNKTNSIDFRSYPHSGARLNGKFYLGPNSDFDQVVKFPNYNQNDTAMVNYVKSVKDKSQVLAEKKVYELPPFPDPPSDYIVIEHQQIEKNQYEKHDVIKNNILRIDNYIVRDTDYVFQLNENVFFKEIKISSDYTLKINVGNSDKTIIVDHLNIENGHIELIGNGHLTIYVKDKITMGSGSRVNEHGNRNQLTIYLKGSNNPSNPKKLTISDSQLINGSFFGEDTDITITSGGGFKGHIITGGKNVTLSGGTHTETKLFFAPNAELNIKEGAHLTGIVIAKKTIMSGGCSITYDTLNFDELPFFNNPGSNDGNASNEFLLGNLSSIKEE